MTEENETTKKGLEHLSDETLASLVEEEVNAGGDLRPVATAAFLELARRTPQA